MNSAASRPPHSASQSLQQSTTGLAALNQAAEGSAQPAGSSDLRPPKRPQLMGPPARPKPPKPAPEPKPAVPEKPPEPEAPKLIGPISAPSERMQYRAIGLLRGKYVASEEQFNRGNIHLENDTLIDAVLLGRATNLIKKHIDLETNHLWVVYPRTLYKEDTNEPALHMQIVGVWEPETLNASDKKASDTDEKAPGEKESESPRYLSTEEATEQRDQFSVRGEIAKYTEETGEIVVNIVQKSRSENTKPKRPFKLLISGKLEGRTTGYFWDFKVKREGGQLMLEEATQVAVVPPKKKSKDARSSGGRKRPAGKPRSGSAVPKPMPKKKKAEGEGSVAEVETNQVNANAVEAAEAKTSAAAKPIEAKAVAAETVPDGKVEAEKVEAKAIGAKKADMPVAEETKTADKAASADLVEVASSAEATQPDNTDTQASSQETQPIQTPDKTTEGA